jgi:hypothetical protein
LDLKNGPKKEKINFDIIIEKFNPKILKIENKKIIITN